MIDEALNERINDVILLVDRVKRGGTLTYAEALRLEATVGEMASRIRQRWLAPVTLDGPALTAVDAFAAPAHNPGARVVATGGGR